MISRLVLAAILALTAPAASLAQTVVIVRHAEKVDDSKDPDLSEAGRARAAALAEALKGARLTLVLATPLKRTVQTGFPAAQAAGLVPTPVPLDGGVAAHAARVAEAARAVGPDATVLVVGHSNTVPDIARALGDPAPEALTDCDYDRMTVIQLGGPAPKAIHARYGVRTESC
jgi:broad specificity phosphatase PhoE